jgi:hypothetical protein
MARERKGIQIGKEEAKLSQFTDDILYLDVPSKSLKTPPKTHRSDEHFHKVVNYKINIKKSVAFLCINNEQRKPENNPIHNSLKKLNI